MAMDLGQLGLGASSQRLTSLGRDTSKRSSAPEIMSRDPNTQKDLEARSRANTKANEPQAKSFSDKLKSQEPSSAITNKGDIQKNVPASQKPGEEVAVEKNIVSQPLPPPATAKELSIQKFVTKMEKEFGIAPEDILKAFSELTDSELMAPPEKSVDSMLGLLELDPEQKAQAKTMFLNMLEESSSHDFADYLSASGQDLNLQLLSKQEVYKQKLDQSLSSMNKTFFVDNKKMAEVYRKQFEQGASSLDAGIKSQQLVATDSLAADENSQTKNSQAILDDNLLSEKMGTEKQSKAEGLGLAAKLMAPLAATAAASAQLQGPKAEASHAQAAVSGSAQNALSLDTSTVDSAAQAEPFDLAKLSLEPADAAGGDAGLDGVKLESESLLKSSAAKAKDASSNNLTAQALTGVDVGQDADQQDASMDSDSHTAGYLNTQTGSEKAKAAQAAQGQFVVEAPKAGEAEESANVSQLIQNAKVMIKNGGGEMKIQMSPEGMGHVDLKVALENGRVNVEMVASNQDAKKVLEKGLGELKATLASHNLNVDAIKVDVSTQMQNDLARQQQDAERQMAQHFLNQFHQDNQDRRQGFFDTPGPRAYRSQTRDEAEDTLSMSASSRNKSASSKRLDLVA